jgi:predicted nucleotidyltransferase
MRLRSHFKKKDIFIIGCGRSGTSFTSKLFSQNGMEIGHETLGKDGMASWMGTVHSKKELDKGYKLILHQVRNPIDTISSLQTFNDHSWNYIQKHISEIQNRDSMLEKSMKYWYHWNLLAEQKTNFRYKVEEIESVFPFIIKILNRKIVLNKEGLKKVNSRKGEFKKVTWSDLKSISAGYYDKCKYLAQKYGYEG